jgi:hypothetical protein
MKGDPYKITPVESKDKEGGDALVFTYGAPSGKDAVVPIPAGGRGVTATRY